MRAERTNLRDRALFGPGRSRRYEKTTRTPPASCLATRARLPLLDERRTGRCEGPLRWPRKDGAASRTPPAPRSAPTPAPYPRDPLGRCETPTRAPPVTPFAGRES